MQRILTDISPYQAYISNCTDSYIEYFIGEQFVDYKEDESCRYEELKTATSDVVIEFDKKKKINISKYPLEYSILNDNRYIYDEFIDYQILCITDKIDDRVIAIATFSVISKNDKININLTGTSINPRYDKYTIPEVSTFIIEILKKMYCYKPGIELTIHANNRFQSRIKNNLAVSCPEVILPDSFEIGENFDEEDKYFIEICNQLKFRDLEGNMKLALNKIGGSENETN